MDLPGNVLRGLLSDLYLNSTFVKDARATHLSQNRTFMASHMAEVDQEVATALFSRTGGQNKSDSNEMSSKQQRKLNRMKAVRESLGKEKNEKFLVGYCPLPPSPAPTFIFKGLFCAASHENSNLT